MISQLGCLKDIPKMLCAQCNPNTSHHICCADAKCEASGRSLPCHCLLLQEHPSKPFGSWIPAQCCFSFHSKVKPFSLGGYTVRSRLWSNTWLFAGCTCTCLLAPPGSPEAYPHLLTSASAISSEWNVLFSVHLANSHAPFQCLLLGPPVPAYLKSQPSLQILLSVHFTFPKAPITSSLCDLTVSFVYGCCVQNHETHKAGISASLKDAPDAWKSVNYGV